MGPILAVLLSSLIGERHTTRTSRLTEMQIMGGLRSVPVAETEKAAKAFRSDGAHGTCWTVLNQTSQI